MNNLSVKHSLFLSVAIHLLILLGFIFQFMTKPIEKTAQLSIPYQEPIIQAMLYQSVANNKSVKFPIKHRTEIKKSGAKIKAEPAEKKVGVLVNNKDVVEKNSEVKKVNKQKVKSEKLAHRALKGSLQDKVMYAIYQQILAHRYYPLLARKRQHQGMVLVKFRFSNQGLVNDLKVIKSSGYIELDKAAISAVLKAQPFSDSQSLVGLSISIPMKFSLT